MSIEGAILAAERKEKALQAAIKTIDRAKFADHKDVKALRKELESAQQALDTLNARLEVSYADMFAAANRLHDEIKRRREALPELAVRAALAGDLTGEAFLAEARAIEDLEHRREGLTMAAEVISRRPSERSAERIQATRKVEKLQQAIEQTIVQLVEAEALKSLSPAG